MFCYALRLFHILNEPFEAFLRLLVDASKIGVDFAIFCFLQIRYSLHIFVSAVLNTIFEFCPYLVSYLIQIGILIVALANLIYQVYKGQKK